MVKFFQYKISNSDSNKREMVLELKNRKIDQWINELLFWIIIIQKGHNWGAKEDAVSGGLSDKTSFPSN